MIISVFLPIIIDDIKVMTDIPPIAGFTTTETTTFAGASIYFKNTAVFADSLVWYFEGAEPGFSSDSNPVNILYSQAGKYDVTQVAFNENGKDSIVLHRLY
jgi:PKD repeat protein